MTHPTSTQHRHPRFYHPTGEPPHLLGEKELPDPKRLDYFYSVPLLAGHLNYILEPRRIVTREGQEFLPKLSVQEVLLEEADFYDVPVGAVVFQEGSFGEHLFFVLEDAQPINPSALSQPNVCISTRIPWDLGEQTPEKDLEVLWTGDFFGEMSVLSMNAHLITAKVVKPTRLLCIPQFVVQSLNADRETFRTAIGQKYAERVINTLLRRVPLFRFSSDEDITKLAQQGEIKTYRAGEIIFEEGDPAKDIYLIHQGFVKIEQQSGTKKTTLNYLVAGDSFGETGVLAERIEQRVRSADAIATSQVEVLVLPGNAFSDTVNSNPAAKKEARHIANRKLLVEDMTNVTIFRERHEVWAEIMPNLDILAIDETLCIRCDNCVKACAAAHEDGISRLIRKGTMIKEHLLPTACRFCQDPVCLLCGSGGIKRDKDGDIFFTDSCIGCGQCAERCPYDNIIMVSAEEFNQPPRPTLARDLHDRVMGKWSTSGAPEKRPKSMATPIKCDLDRDHLFPACVNNCPTQAIRRYSAEELDDEIRLLKAKSPVR